LKTRVEGPVPKKKFFRFFKEFLTIWNSVDWLIEISVGIWIFGKEILKARKNKEIIKRSIGKKTKMNFPVFKFKRPKINKIELEKIKISQAKGKLTKMRNIKKKKEKIFKIKLNFFSEIDKKIEIGSKIEIKIEREFKLPNGLKFIFPKIWKKEIITKRKPEVKRGKKSQKISSFLNKLETRK